MSIQLIRTLVRLALNPLPSELSDEALALLNQGSAADWQETLNTLESHRLAPLAFYGLKSHGVLDQIPVPAQQSLHQSYTRTLHQNKLYLLTLSGILRSLEQQQVTPVLWKGIVLADRFYPDLGTRVMNDIDFAIAPHELEQTIAAFQSLGFTVQPDKATEDAIYMINPMEISCDIHHRVRLFEEKDTCSLTTPLTPRSIQFPAITVLEPNAMVAHLVVHADGHYSQLGYLLSWLLDLAFVMQTWGEFLQLERILAFFPDPKHRISLLRILYFLHQDLGQPLPPGLMTQEWVKPLTLETVLRQRRIAPWGLPYLTGWLRLGVYRLGLRSPAPQRYPRWSDLIGWVKD